MAPTKTVRVETVRASTKTVRVLIETVRVFIETVRIHDTVRVPVDCQGFHRLSGFP